MEQLQHSAGMTLSDFRDAWIMAASDFRGRVATRDQTSVPHFQLSEAFLPDILLLTFASSFLTG